MFKVMLTMQNNEVYVGHSILSMISCNSVSYKMENIFDVAVF